MVLYNAASRARNAGKTTNLPNCGGTKKGGLAVGVGLINGTGYWATRRATHTQFGLLCLGNYSNPSQQAAKRVQIGLMG